jgi:hypothetical protein
VEILEKIDPNALCHTEHKAMFTKETFLSETSALEIALQVKKAESLRKHHRSANRQPQLRDKAIIQGGPDSESAITALAKLVSEFSDKT